MNSSNSIKLLVLSISTVLLCASSHGYAQALPDYVPPEKVAFETANAEALAATEGLKVVFYGSGQFKKQMLALGVVAGTDQEELAAKIGEALDESASNQLIIVEKSGRDQALFERLLASGNVIISVGRASIDAADRAFSSIYNTSAGITEQETGLAKIDETKEEVTAYRFSPYGSGIFATDEPNEALAIAEAIRWARDAAMLERRLASLQAPKADSSLDYARTATCTSDQGNVKGKLNLSYTFNKKAESSSSYDYWVGYLTAQAVPVKNARIREIYQSYTLAKLLDYDPTSTVGSSTASVSLASSGFSASWSYAVTGVQITDNGDLEANNAGWTHQFTNAFSAASRKTYKVQPGVLVRVAQGGAVIKPMQLGTYAEFYHKTVTSSEYTTCRWFKRAGTTD
jgi:hypothetical protein